MACNLYAVKKYRSYDLGSSVDKYPSIAIIFKLRSRRIFTLGTFQVEVILLSPGIQCRKNSLLHGTFINLTWIV